MIILKTNSSVTGSKVSKGFPAKEVSGQAAGFVGGKLFLMVRIFSVSQTLKEEVTILLLLLLPRRVLVLKF